MKKTFFALSLLFTTLSLIAAPEEYTTRSASGTTSASVYFEPGALPGQLLVADVTSDKAASVLTWKTGTNQLLVLAPAAADVTNIFTTVGSVVSNASMVSITSDGTMTAYNGFTNSYFTNALVVLENAIGTNVTRTNSIARKLTGTYLTVLSTTSSNVFTVVSNTVQVAAGTNFLFEGMPGQVETNVVLGWVTNGANYDVTLTNAFSFKPTRAYALTNTYPIMFAANGTDSSLILSNATILSPADQIVILPSTGGASLRQIQSTNSYRYQNTNLKSATGVALAAGDRFFVLDAGVSTPVGAATLRLMADPVRVLPKNMPGVLTVDGTSACAINAAVLRTR